MIARLRGRLLEKRPNRAVIDVDGVGYDVHVPLSTFYELPEAGSDVSLRIHTHVREDALTLFGFTTLLELDLFERLISVSGIGPRLALTALSGIEPPELVRAIRDSDVARLTGIPGVGKRTAERMSLELKDKLGDALAPVAPGSDADRREGREDAIRDDVLSALLNLGYHRPLAERAVEASLRGDAGQPFEQVLRQALRELAR